MMKNSLYIIIIAILFTACQAQKPTINTAENTEKKLVFENPKLVVGIVVDQMRYDYLTRFYNKYSDGGFKRLINNGFNCKNNHFNYILDLDMLPFLLAPHQNIMA
mgnify:CR=1 FL=1